MEQIWTWCTFNGLYQAMIPQQLNLKTIFCCFPIAVTFLLSDCGDSRLAAQSVASPQLNQKVKNLVESVIEPEVEITLAKRRSKIIRLKEDVYRVAIADPSLLDVTAFGTREVEFIGKEEGTTSVTLWLGSEDRPQSLGVLVTVTKDTGVEDLRRMEYSELQARINELFPGSRVQLIPIADKLIVRGQARDEQDAVQILALLRKSQGGSSNLGVYQNASPVRGVAADPSMDEPQETRGVSVVNMLRVTGEKQVMLKVRIAELKRSAIRELGVDIKELQIGDVSIASVLNSAMSGNVGVMGTFDDLSFDLVIRALIGTGTAKILAEPNLVVVSGQTANFIAGGEFAVPTAVGVDGVSAASTSFKGFGTQLTFTPTVLDKDRIRLNVSPTFSTLNKTNSVNGIFGLDSRSVSTTVELREGQVLAIAGLLQEQQRGQKNQIPGLGRVPLLNAATSDKSISRDETELLILVSPELVHPLDPEEAPNLLPGMEVTEPDNFDFFYHGAIEGDPFTPFRSTMYENALTRQRIGPKCPAITIQTENYYLSGPHGFSE
ncbi:MAG: pilus assembly protein N-terminal domain-containing protein [Planctomycetaceae bacterium]|nr:pilus assembly protein N-terminal domain-containing protein [Planctomycetaceae bacterium]